VIKLLTINGELFAFLFTMVLSIVLTHNSEQMI